MDDRETPVPDEPITRELRRSMYLIASVDPAVSDVAQALAVDLESVPAVAVHRARSAAALHIGRGFDEGARHEADLRTGLAVIREHLSMLQLEFAEQTAKLTRRCAELEAQIGEMKP